MKPPKFSRKMIDPARAHMGKATGIYLSAYDVHGKRDAVDLATLTRESVVDWLRSEGDDLLAVNTVLALLGHPPLEPKP